ncbi:MAG: 1-acyl-sn-glycerol-3-phosphate acyltransferase [Spirochaetia bacterium]|jgi:1-acyl-sn-glycerol-3-phosphate acyltransferase|nr:1-acyl-sn-glycerol-3-phosphate acyltransferase [Spirochaetia bacterium]
MDFDDIRPYSDKELPEVLGRIIRNKWVLEGVRTAYFSKVPKIFNKFIEYLIHQFLKFKISGIKTTDQFRKKISLDILVDNLVKDTTAGITYSGLENLDLNKNYIFISNHRDIVLDPAFMISTLYNYGFNFPQIAFGDNLMVNKIVEDIIRANNGIIVKRNLPMREQIGASLNLSAYMCNVIENGSSIWIAQREGRAKDGLDKTNPAVLKMIYLSKRKELSFTEFIDKYPIVPVSISYEYDPLDRAKGWSIYRKKIHGSHIKRKYEDLIHMASGLKGYKGHVHLSFSEPLSGKFKNENKAAEEIDKKIHRSYSLWKSNYISYDLLNKSKKNDNKYTTQDVEKFLNRYKRLSEGVREIVFESYANPVTSYENYISSK